MNTLEADLKEVVDKVTGLLGKVQNAEPTLAELLFQAVEQVFLNAGYTKPVEPAQTTTNEQGAQ